MTLRKWDVAWATLDPAAGHEQAGSRPVVVFCNERIAAAISLATVLPVTTLRRGRRIYPSEARLPRGTGGLTADSIVMCHQIRTVALGRLQPPFGNITEPETRAAIEHALGLWLDA